jgi:hypothetical protein
MVSDPVPLTDKPPLQESRHRGLHVVLWLLVAGVALFVLAAPWLLVEAVWDGGFPLALDVRSESGKAIKTLAYATFFKREPAEWVTKHITGQAEDRDSGFRPAVENNGQFLAEVGCSGRTWIFNIETRYTEFRYIVFRVTYDGGKEVRRMAEIPAGRGPRSLTVMVP